MKRFMKIMLAAFFCAFATLSYAVKTTTVAVPPSPPPSTTNTTATTLSTKTATTPAVIVSPAERAKIEEVVHQYLLQQPEVIVEAVQNYQRKKCHEYERHDEFLRPLLFMLRPRLQPAL